MASECKYRRLEEGSGDGTWPSSSSGSDESDIFRSFRASSNKKLLDSLRVELKGLQSNLQFAIFLLKIRWCNAKYSTSFSNAFCHVERQMDLETQNRIAYSFLSVFWRGYNMLESFLSDANYMPQRKGEKTALAKLLAFLMNTQATSKALFFDADDPHVKVTETEWTTRLAHHVLSKLAVNPSYFLNKHCHFKRRTCPCCQEEIEGRYADTSIGCTDGWHGYIDIVMGVQELPIIIIPKEPDSPGGSQSSIEIKTDDLKKSRSQILAETIVFSFLQKRIHPEYDNYLIPTIAMSRKNVGFSFYDSENDMLMETQSVPLLENRELFQPTILALWLTVNYRYFCSGINKGMQERKFTSEFYGQIEECIDVYQNHIKFECGSKSKEPGLWESFHTTVENPEPATSKEVSKD